jgi:Ca2+-binding EF-hand superfamily protein
MSLDDGILKMYIDEVFQVYDYDRSGTLEYAEVHNFFNQLYASLNEPRRFTEPEMRQLFTTIDI